MKFFGSEIGLGFGTSSQSSSSSGTSTTQKKLSQEAIDKIMYDVLSSDQGLAALAGAENMSGGFGSSTKGLMAQDLAVKLAGEIANITAETVTTTTNESSQKGKQMGAKTVICTHLMEQGLLDKELYAKGHTHFSTLSSRTVIGYHLWAEPMVELMKKYKWLNKFFAPIARSRYEMIVNGKFGILGAVTIYILQPFCYVTGFLMGVPNGTYVHS